MSSLDKFTSAFIGAPLDTLHGSDNFSGPMCSSLSSGRTCSAVGVLCDGPDDDDDPPCAKDANTVCDVETGCETNTIVCSANLNFSCLVSHQILNVTFFHALP